MIPKIPIVGVGPDGLAGLTSRSREVLQAAEVVFGSDAALRLLPELQAERVRIGSDLPDIVEKLKSGLGTKRQVVAAIGDPLFYGTARYLCDKVGPDAFEVVPHVSSMQLAFARIMETWEEAYLTDLSAKKLDDVLDKIRSAETVGLFTSETTPPNRVARELLARGIDYFRAYVCENLGGKDERITQGELSEIQDLRFDPLNIMILKRKPNRADSPRRTSRLPASATRMNCSPNHGPKPDSSPKPKCARLRWHKWTYKSATWPGMSAPGPGPWRSKWPNWFHRVSSMPSSKTRRIITSSWRTRSSSASPT